MTNWDHTLSTIEARGATLSPGLTQHELRGLSGDLGILFPPDLAAFLAAAVPVGPHWPSWRKPDQLKGWLEGPLNGILFDIEHNDFWWNPWGARPTALETAIAVATQRFEDFPRLTPVYAHRYLLSSPLRPGNPVFSVHQTDIIYYGADLPRYFAAEFDGMPHAEAIAGADPVPFWGELS